MLLLSPGTGGNPAATIYKYVERALSKALPNLANLIQSRARAIMAFTEEQMHAIMWGSRCSSLLSLVGSFFIVGTFLFSSRFKSSINRLIFYATLANLLTAAGFLMSVYPIRKGPNRPFCQFQAFILQWYGSFVFMLMPFLCLFLGADQSQLLIVRSSLVTLHGLQRLPDILPSFQRFSVEMVGEDISSILLRTSLYPSFYLLIRSQSKTREGLWFSCRES